MLEIIMWSLLAFFGAFGVIEFIRFIYTDWKNCRNYYHVVVNTKGKGENVEAIVRNAILATDAGSLLVIDDGSDDYVKKVLKKMTEKYAHIVVMTMEEYIDFLHSKEC